MYCGDENFNARKVIRRILYIKRCSTGSQWRLFKTGVICAYFLVLVTTKCLCQPGNCLVFKFQGCRSAFERGSLPFARPLYMLICIN